jgi:septal ring factor EnvC (AmiA/AmiB activator)
MNLVAKVLICALLAYSGAIAADDRASKQKELDMLKTRIEKLRSTIEIKEKSRSSNQTRLRLIESKIGELAGEIRATNNQLKASRKVLRNLTSEQAKIEQRIEQHNKLLAQQLYAAYTVGPQERVKLLFSQQNAAQMQRNLVYYQYLNRQRLDLIETARQNQLELERNELETRQAKVDLERILEQQQKQKASLTRDRNQRQNILGALEKELKKQGKDLSRLEANARHLGELIESLSDILADVPDQRPEQQKFAKLRGKLAWPAKGEVANLYGNLKPPSNLRWQGVIIRAPMGNNVRAVSHGRVAFADWLRGMGNLIIIDHGDGYLSLYGHNQSLFKTTGDWVEPGEIIASVGNSGGQKKAGVYFEIRKRGQPQNPGRWCKTSNWFAT